MAESASGEEEGEGEVGGVDVGVGMVMGMGTEGRVIFARELIWIITFLFTTAGGDNNGEDVVDVC